MRESTLRRIEKMKMGLEKIRRYSEMEMGEILLRPEICDSVERNIQICVEGLVDISRKIISELNWRIPLQYKDTFQVLFENKLINENLLTELKDLAGLRNLIIHWYAEVEIEKVYENSKKYVNTIEKALKLLLEFCKSKQIDP